MLSSLTRCLLCLSRCFLVISNSNLPRPEKKGRKKRKKRKKKEIDEDKKQSLHRELIIPSRQQFSARNCSSQRGKPIVALGPQLRDMHEAGMGQLALKILHLILFSSQLPSSDSAIAQATLLDLATRFQSDICEKFDLDNRQTGTARLGESHQYRSSPIYSPKKQQPKTVLNWYKYLELLFLA